LSRVTKKGQPSLPTESQTATEARPIRLLGIWRVPFFYGWVIVAVVFVAEFVASGVGGFVTPLFFKPLTEEFGWSLTLLTGAVTAQTIAYSAISPFLGPLLDRFGARPVMLFGAVFAGLGLILLTRITEIWQFWILYAAVGALGLHEMGGFTGPVLVTKWFVRLRGRAMALATLGTTLGGMVMAPVLGFLITTLGWRDAWGVMGMGVLVIMIPLVLLFMRNQPEDMGLQPDGDRTDESPSAEKRVSAQHRGQTEMSWTLKEALRTRSMWLLIIALNLVHLSASVIVLHLIPFLTLQEGVSAQVASLVLTMRLAASSLSRLLWGFASERLPMNLCLTIAFLSRASHPLALALLPYPVNVIVVIVTSITGGGFQVLQPLAFANYFGRRYSGAIQGATRPFLTISSLVGPLLISIVFDLTGTFNLAFLVAGGMGVVGAGVALFATPPRRRDSEGSGATQDERINAS
jgi:sugar phosphate permease